MKHFVNIFCSLALALTVSNVIGQDRLPCVNKTFSVVVHIVLDSLGDPGITETKIQQNFDTTNRYFSPICVRFEICEFRYVENFKYDEFHKEDEFDEVQTLYFVDNRINVFYVKELEDPAGMCGFASLAGITNLNNGGIVIKKTGTCCDAISKTLTHEMGHYFGLEHTFEGNGTELADGSNCSTAGDQICDTPGDPYVSGAPMTNYVQNCRFIFTGKDANGDYYNPHVGNMMSYYPDECNCGFTFEQYKRMASVYLSGTGMW